MRKKSFIAVLVLVGLLVALGMAVRSNGGGSVTRWLASMHGSGR